MVDIRVHMSYNTIKHMNNCSYENSYNRKGVYGYEEIVQN